MTGPIKLPTELRWRCRECGKDFPNEDLHTPFGMKGIMAQLSGGAYDMFVPRSDDPFKILNELAAQETTWLPFSGPLERGHKVSWTTGGRAGVMGGWTQHSRICGPLRLTLIDTQEIFVEWCVGDRP